MTYGMRHDEETDRVLRALADQLGRSERAEAREIAEAVTGGTYSFGEIAASSGYAEFMEETLQRLEGLAPEDFGRDGAEPEPRPEPEPEPRPGAAIGPVPGSGPRPGFGRGIGPRF